jgi:integrase
LRALKPESSFVCPDGEEQHRDWWDAVRKAAKVEDFRWHDLRHTFASRLVMNGVDILTVNKLLRHKTLQVTMRYAHLAATHLHDAIERLVGVTNSVTPAAETIAPSSQTIH